ncbi:MAG: S-methyl-5'-thioadenosine phosphorylase [Thermoplasmata archaeon]|jgi:5'-methylthioadenosine phosphorylase|nr:S-methyl-5'-thioadenosine phosphorylase [Euryarchaeota archaeon]MVT36049.1 S-methyl-5'-thioadenosine phosphorylase [Euryarchaeota archaeon]
MEKASVAIIGGSGIGEIFEEIEKIIVHTPYGSPSDYISIGKISGVTLAFLPRHGKGHRIPPHKINYRANIFALKEIGIEKVIGISAVGSLKENLRPGDLAIVSQFIDFTKKREYTFYDGPKVVHISMADPFSEDMNNILSKNAKNLGFRVHENVTYICIEGPRFSTRAESRMFRNFADIIGMTLVPEINLARELGMCYSTLATITDYDVWSEKPVTAEEVMKIMRENEYKAKEVIKNSIKEINELDSKKCKKVLEESGV